MPRCRSCYKEGPDVKSRCDTCDAQLCADCIAIHVTVDLPTHKVLRRDYKPVPAAPESSKSDM